MNENSIDNADIILNKMEVKSSSSSDDSDVEQLYLDYRSETGDTEIVEKIFQV